MARIGRFLDAIGLDRVNLVADDYGAHLALGFAARYPDRVLRLGLLNSRAHRTFAPIPWLMFGAIGVLARAPLLNTLLTHAPIAAAHRMLARRYLRKGCFDRELLNRDLAWMNTVEGRRWFVRFYQHYQLRTRADMLDDLETFACPVAIIRGDHDPYCPPAIARELADRVPGASLEWQPGADHFVAEQRPADVLAAIRRLLGRPA